MMSPTTSAMPRPPEAADPSPGDAVLLTEVFPPRHGGSGRWFWESYRRLPEFNGLVIAGHTVGALSFDAQQSLKIRRMNLSFRDTGAWSWGGLRAYWRVVRELQAVHARTPISMLHCGRCITEGWAGWLFQRRTGVPYLCYVHGEDVNLAGHATGYGVMSSRQHRWMARRVLRGAVLLIANSRNSRDILQSQWGVELDRIHVVNPGVDVDRFRPAPLDCKVRDRLGWTDREVLLTVGRLQRRKGHDTLIRALAKLRETHPRMLYAIAGDGEESNALQQLALDLGIAGHVQFLGSVGDDELVALYQQCDLFVLPNRSVGSDVEGFGMVLLEAQACGRPVVAGQSGGTAETMSIPHTGRVVPCEGGPELEMVLTELLNAPQLRAEMGQAAREWACKNFSWSAVAERMNDAFEAARRRSGKSACYRA